MVKNGKWEREEIMEKKHMETRLVQGFSNKENQAGSLTSPLYQTSTFVFDSSEQGEARFSGVESGYIYSRLGNPTVEELERKIADLEGAEMGVAFSSGMAAVSSVLLSIINSGDHILVSEGIYGCTFGFLNILKEKFKVDFDLIKMDDPENILKSIRENTTVIYIETPINPTMKLVDIEQVAKIAKDKGIKTVVDNTFCSPYLQRPIQLGADIVIHSATKYIGGHGDVIAGLAVGPKDFMEELKMTVLKDVGGVLSPFDAWLLLRGLKTLAIRMDRHCENTKVIAERLKTHPMINRVIYPGDKSFEQYELAKEQMDDFGGLISFDFINDKKEVAQQFMNELKMIHVAVSLGDVETLIQHPATMTHSGVPEEERTKMGITHSMLRLSIGLENVDDIWNDLENALNKLQI